MAEMMMVIYLEKEKKEKRVERKEISNLVLASAAHILKMERYRED